MTYRFRPPVLADSRGPLERDGTRAFWTAVGVEDRSGRWFLRVAVGDQSVRTPVGGKAPLSRFIALSQYSGQRLADRTLAFALSVGPIDFCQCGQPWPCYNHSSGALGQRATELHPVAWYANLAATFGGMARVATAIKLGRRPEPNDQRTVLDACAPGGAAAFEAGGLRVTSALLRRLMVDHLNDWLARTQVTVRLDWDGEPRPRLVVAQPRPFSRLATALAFAIYRAPDVPPAIVACAGCGEPTSKPRQPRAGESSWCDKAACLKIKNRIAQQRVRTGQASRKRRKRA